MTPRIRRLMVTGMIFIATALAGLAVTIGDPAARSLVRYVFTPAYVIGALLIIAAGMWWLMDYTKRTRRPDD
jgi:putative Mn2+ efflux pump MntP